MAIRVVTDGRKSDEGNNLIPVFVIIIQRDLELFEDVGKKESCFCFSIEKENWVNNLLEFFKECNEEQLKKMRYSLGKTKNEIDGILFEILKHKYQLKFNF